MVRITVDGRQIEAPDGETLLHTCLENGIYIPNLCYMDNMKEPTGSCRLCFVEIEGEDKLHPACKTKVQDGMVVRTDAPSVRQLQKVVFQLLFSTHHMECRKCLVRKTCELQKIAKLLGVRLKAAKVDHLKCDLASKRRHPCLELISSKCILCRKCLFVCQEKNDEPVLTLVKNGAEPQIDFAGNDYQELHCDECRACVEVCPVNAIVPKEDGTLEPDSA